MIDFSQIRCTGRNDIHAHYHIPYLFFYSNNLDIDLARVRPTMSHFITITIKNDEMNMLDEQI